MALLALVWVKFNVPSARLAVLAIYRGGIPCRNAEFSNVSFRVLVGGPSQYMPLVTERVFIIALSWSFVTTADALNESELWLMFHCRVNSCLQTVECSCDQHVYHKILVAAHQNLDWCVTCWPLLCCISPYTVKCQINAPA